MQGFYEFHSFRLDLKKRRLMRGDKIISLTPKEFEVLFLLIENAGRVVEKDELLDAVWKDTFVEEATLTRNISWLRKKLADGGDTKFIETVPKRGYRFLPEVTKNSENLIVIEERIIQQIEIEEIIEIAPSPRENQNGSIPAGISAANLKNLPAAPVTQKLSPLWIIPVVLLLSFVAFVIDRGYFSKKQADVIIASNIAPFSGLPGRENSPDFSPDGKQLVFSWDGGVDGANSDIYVKLIGTGEPVRLTNTAAEEINPTFSPDGKSIAFVRILPGHNEIILIPALGGAERKIYEKASYASVSFSPDGKSIATAELDLATKETGIFTIDLPTGAKTRLTMPDAPVVDHTPRFSPDGKSLAFIRYFSSFHREIFVVPAIGGSPRQITDDDVRIYGLSWNPDGEKLFFTSFRQMNQLGLWEISASGGEPRIIQTGSNNLQDLAISPDGKAIAFVEETADENIWEIEPDKPPRPLIRSTRADHSEEFSPDNSQIVFASDRTGNDEIWLADADGKNQRQLTDSEKSAGSPRFSPDGKFIAYDAQIAGGSDIYVVSVNGGEPRRLTEDGKNNGLPAWSVDGKWIFFNSGRSGDAQIWKIPATGGEAVQITKQGAFEMRAAPNGKTIIYSKGDGKSGLWQTSVGGGDEQPIPELADAGVWRSWSVTATGIYFVPFTTQPPFHLEVFDFATRQIGKITDFEKPPLSYYSNLSISSDGNKILYARQDQNSSSIMIAKLEL